MTQFYSQEQTKTALEKYISEGSIEKGSIPEIVLDSWERSRRNKKIDPYSAKPVILYRGEDLEQHLCKYNKLIDISLPIMQTLYDFIKDGRYIISLADAQACLLTIIGDKSIKSAAAQSGREYTPGAVWSEEAIGTNGVGTPLLLDRPLQILGWEHYRVESHPWGSSAAPIHNPDGKLVGLLSIVGPAKEVHAHTLGMAVTAVNAIETQLQLRDAFSSLELSNNHKNAIIESINEGLLAVNEKGVVTHINSIVARYLGTNVEDAINTSVYLVAGEKNGELINVINCKRYVTDIEIAIVGSKIKSTFLITSRPIECNGVWHGMVILFSEISRAQKLVQRMGGANGNVNFSNIIGKDPLFLETVELARKAANSTSSVLLLGESGTGKDVFAQAIHNTGNRRDGPFVAINCGAIPRELIGSEMFGYVDGAFTGAKRGGKLGKFELASGGTIFLDEIGEMPLELQPTLLRVLEAKTITRVGGNEVIDVDVRIIAATNKDLEKEVNLGKFRQDLFYRLNVFTIRMMPLRERKEDISLLVDYFLGNLCVKLKKLPIRIDRKAMETLERYPWPGNIRELQNVLERVVNICNETIITEDMIPSEIGRIRTFDTLLPVQNYEKELIKELLGKYNRNITRVANELGIARTTLYQRIAKYNL